MIGGITWSTPTSGSLLKDEKEGENEKDGADEEDVGVGGGVLALRIGGVASSFLF